MLTPPPNQTPATPHADGVHAYQRLTEDAEAAVHPALDELRQIFAHPDRHTIGDLAALTERLTSEMMLFHALVGGPLAQVRADDAPATDVSIDFVANFLRDLADAA
jgi:hypothetical protein